jgi:hypothetical protein
MLQRGVRVPGSLLQPVRLLLRRPKPVLLTQLQPFFARLSVTGPHRCMSVDALAGDDTLAAGTTVHRRDARHGDRLAGADERESEESR